MSTKEYQIIFICKSTGKYITLDDLGYLLSQNRDYEILIPENLFCEEIEINEPIKRTTGIRNVYLKDVMISSLFEKQLIFNPKLNAHTYSKEYCDKLLKLEAKYGIRYDIDVFKTRNYIM